MKEAKKKVCIPLETRKVNLVKQLDYFKDAAMYAEPYVPTPAGAREPRAPRAPRAAPAEGKKRAPSAYAVAYGKHRKEGMSHADAVKAAKADTAGPTLAVEEKPKRTRKTKAMKAVEPAIQQMDAAENATAPAGAQSVLTQVLATAAAEASEPPKKVRKPRKPAAPKKLVKPEKKVEAKKEEPKVEAPKKEVKKMSEDESIKETYAWIKSLTLDELQDENVRRIRDNVWLDMYHQFPKIKKYADKHMKYKMKRKQKEYGASALPGEVQRDAIKELVLDYELFEMKK